MDDNRSIQLSVRQILLQNMTITGLPPLVLPDTFYVSFRVKFDSSEIGTASDAGLFAFNFGESVDSQMEFNGTTYSSMSAWLDISPDFPFTTLTFGSALTGGTYYVFDVKVDRSVDHQTITITYRLDGSEIGSLSTIADTPWTIDNFILGQQFDLSGSGGPINRDFDYFNIGSSGYGSSDLFADDFSSGPAPFDSFQGDVGNITISGGTMNITNTGLPAYAQKACA